MLLQRLLTALVLLPVVLAIAWFAPLGWLFVAFSAIGILGAYEWSALLGLTTRPARLAYTAGSALILALAWALQAYWQWLAAIEVLWWLFALYLMFGFPENLQRHRPGTLALGILGPLLWTPAVLSLVMLRAMPQGAERLIFLLALVWAADVGAYLAGRNFGRIKLAPKVSPGKTREGAIGGLVVCVLWAIAAGAYVFMPNDAAQLLKVVVLSFAVAALSIVGDLGISMFKRLSGIKDSGKLLPGHGGILDRVDSLLAAAPAMALGLYWLKL
ncbi:MAG: phosphatidate cytidylyltransferase [Nevskia sp.]|nr:phosphatidate cytidylyltransferase [Nevskia sp.]